MSEGLKEGAIDSVLHAVKNLIPRSVFDFFAPAYHAFLAYAGAVMYGFPSRKMKVIGVTGTKGKSSVVFMISKVLEETGHKTAACGSLGFKIKDKEWPNNLRMTMPGRFKLHKLMADAAKAGCEYFVLEVTSEGIKQKRHIGIDFDCAVFTNIHKEHLESHGSFDKYLAAKQELFKTTGNIHVINADDPNFEMFSKFPSKKTIFYGLGDKGDMKAENVVAGIDSVEFDVYGTHLRVPVGGLFNVSNCLAVLAVSAMYGIDVPKAKSAIEKINGLPGRMEFVQKEPFAAVVDYAHTPDSLEAVYKTLKKETKARNSNLICILGATGGGRDKWKRPEFGRIADDYCDQIILTNEDPYDEDPMKIIQDVRSGVKNHEPETVLDRKEAIARAVSLAKPGDIVISTGKGSETTMAVAGNKKIPWSEKNIFKEALLRR